MMQLFPAFLLVVNLGLLHARSVKDEELDEMNGTIVKINIGISEIKEVIEKATKIKKGRKGGEEKEKGGVGDKGETKGENKGSQPSPILGFHLSISIANTREILKGNGPKEMKLLCFIFEKYSDPSILFILPNKKEILRKYGKLSNLFKKEKDLTAQNRLYVWKILARGEEEGEFYITDHIFQVNEHEHKEDDLMEGDILISKGQDETYHGIHGDLIIGNSHYWPSFDGGKHVYIPYAYGSRLTQKAKTAFQQAVAEYNTRTCIRFIRRTNQPDYVNLISRAGCYASVGKQGGDQTVSIGIGCETKGIAIHELMHAIGYYHEQSRSDRDNYITIDFNQIRPGKENNFKKRNSDSQGTEYDYNSVMHYGPYDFAKSNKPTIKVKKGGYKIGQRNGFSKIDLISINAKYCARSNCYDIWKRCDRVRYFCDPHWFLLLFKGLVRRNCGSTCNVC